MIKRQKQIGAKSSKSVQLQIEMWQLPAPPDGSEDCWRISLLRDPEDYHAALLASLGLNYDCISAQTGLSKGQIARRLKAANANRKGADRISALNYRNGTSQAAQVVITAAAKKVSTIVTQQLRETQAAVDI